MYCFVHKKLNTLPDMLNKKKNLCYFFIANIEFYGVKVGIFYRIAFYVVLIKLIVTLKTAKNWTQINFQKQLCQNNVIE